MAGGKGPVSKPRRTVIMGAAGRDFHNFNMVYRGDPGAEDADTPWIHRPFWVQSKAKLPDHLAPQGALPVPGCALCGIVVCRISVRVIGTFASFCRLNQAKFSLRQVLDHHLSAPVTGTVSMKLYHWPIQPLLCKGIGRAYMHIALEDRGCAVILSSVSAAAAKLWGTILISIVSP